MNKRTVEAYPNSYHTLRVGTCVSEQINFLTQHLLKVLTLLEKQRDLLLIKNLGCELSQFVYHVIYHHNKRWHQS